MPRPEPRRTYCFKNRASPCGSRSQRSGFLGLDRSVRRNRGIHDSHGAVIVLLNGRRTMSPLNAGCRPRTEIPEVNPTVARSRKAINVDSLDPKESPIMAVLGSDCNPSLRVSFKTKIRAPRGRGKKDCVVRGRRVSLADNCPSVRPLSCMPMPHFPHHPRPHLRAETRDGPKTREPPMRAAPSPVKQGISGSRIGQP